MRSSTLRVAIVGAATAGAALLAPGLAAAQTVTPLPCPRPLALLRATCGRLEVAADHTGRVPGVQHVAFARLPATGLSRGTITVLPGGPGEAALTLGAPLVLIFAPLLSDHDLLLVDPRGTGLSDATRCRVPVSVTATPALLTAVAACGEQLGPRRATLTSAEQARDLEDVRAALGIPRLTLIGASYGTKVAAEYVRRFPASTERVVLDSPVPVDGLDAATDLPSLALPRVMREVCWPPGCRALAGDADPQRTLARLVARLQRGPMTGRLVGPSGASRTVRIDTERLYTLLLTSDADPLVRVDVPAAMRSALAGDPAYLARLVRPVSPAAPPDPGNFDAGRFLATLCVESRLPWRPEAPPAGRREALLAQLIRDAARYVPFPPSVVAPAANATACLTWPATPAPDPVPVSAPPVPTLVVSGREDLRTPVEDARRTAAQYPDARVLAVPDVGHSVLVNDPRRCALRGVAAFLADRPVAACARGPRPLLGPAAFIPADVDRLPRAPGVSGLPGRTATAVVATLLDSSRQALRTALTGRRRAGGLRGGTLTVGERAVTLRGVEVVRGVRVTGTVRVRGTAVTTARMAVSGPRAAPGVVSLRGPRLTGTLGGRQIDQRVGALIAG
jgi:pimeloyl-ACP methyl ester carboxylesterase